MRVQVLVVDDSPVIRKCLCSWIEQNTPWAICGEAADGAVALDIVSELFPDLVILDFLMPVMNGLQAARRIALISPRTTIVMFSLHVSEPLIAAAHLAGVRAVVDKTGDGVDALFSTASNLLRS